MRITVFFFNLILILCLLSCASVSKEDRLFTYLTDDKKFLLLHPGGIEQNMDMMQYVSAEYMGRSYFFNAWVKADENAIDIVFLNEMGASAAVVSFKDGDIKFTSSVFPDSVMRFFKPEYIISDFQLCFYDPVLLEKALKEAGLILEIRDNSRIIKNGNEAIMEIQKKENSVRLDNYLRGYAYTLGGDFI